MQSEAAPSVDLTLNKGVLRDQNAPEVIKASGSDTAVESVKNVVDDATVGKKRNFFGTNARIKPLGAIEEAAPQAVEAAGGRAIQPVAAPSGGKIQAQPAWSDLPDMVVAMIMTRVRAEYLSQMGKKEGDVMGAAHNLGAVCRSWRQIARHTFFSEWWAQGKIVHALQCFSLASSPLSGLLKCYVQRTQMRNCMRFTAYQGDRPDAVGSRFLMAADVNRFGMTLYLAKGESLPCARVSSNVFCTRYEFIKNHTVGPFDAPWQPPKKHESLCLADVEYRTRIRGCMRPRRMRVLLPDQSVLRKYGPHTAQATAQECGEVASEVDEAHGSAQSSPPGSFNASLKAATEVAKVSWESPERRRSGGWDSLPSGPALKPGEWLELENKAPHWNENLKCWCLNFRGRVKFASVKNFQLVDAANPDAIVMQFGKVAFNTYILDFQPGTICAAQAFAIALSAFNKGFTP